MLPKLNRNPLATRFRGFLPIVLDIETSGLNPLTDALLEIAIVVISLNAGGLFYPKKSIAFHVEPFMDAHFNAESLEITGIDPDDPLRYPIPEKQALHRIFTVMQEALDESGCQRAVLVAHNAWFDLAFLQAAAKRNHFLNVPYHSFTTFDTATLSGVLLGETVLAKAMREANISFDVNLAHSAEYDALKTAELFCYMMNRLKK